MTSSLHLNSFLRFGYFLDYTPELEFRSDSVDRGRYTEATETELLVEYAALLRTAVGRRLQHGRRNLLPLSGGLDSRALLAVLLETTPAANISTYTFGTPGTYDYEIGNLVARQLQTRHRSFPLTEYEYTTEKLLAISPRVRHQTVLFHHPPIDEVDRHFEDHTVWSGFLGDPLAGFDGDPDRTPDEARRTFIEKNTYTRSTVLSHDDSEDLATALRIDGAESSGLLADDELNLRYRQLRFTAPHVLPLGFDYQTPFLDQDLSTFMLSLPLARRRKATLYRRLLTRTYPTAFSIPNKSDHGLPMSASRLRVLARRALRKVVRRGCPAALRPLDRMTNYIDFAVGIRTRSDLKKVFSNNLADLRKRHLLDWIDIDRLWNEHRSGQRDHSSALIVLASLELHLKAGMTL